MAQSKRYFYSNEIIKNNTFTTAPYGGDTSSVSLINAAAAAAGTFGASRKASLRVVDARNTPPPTLHAGIPSAVLNNNSNKEKH